MKKVLLISLTAAIVLTKSAMAQDASQNVVKLNLFSLGFSEVSLQYERALHKNISVGLQVGFIPTRSLPSQISSFTPSDFSDFKISGLNITPEFRWYPGKKVEKQAPRGFYLAAYLRYFKYSANSSFSFTDSTNNTKQVTPFTISYSGIGLGVMLGYQWIINNRVSIDWWILGGQGSTWGSVSGTSTVPSGLDVSDVKKQMDSIDFNGATKTVTTSGNDVTLKISGLPYAGLRSGLCIGIAF